MHVLSVGVDLLPALDAQGFDGEEMVAAVAEACRRGGGDGAIPDEAAAGIRAASQVLNIEWIAEALDSPASVICPRSGACPRQPHGACSGECRAERHIESGRLLFAAIRSHTRIYRLGETRTWIRAAVVVNPVDRCCEI